MEGERSPLIASNIERIEGMLCLVAKEDITR
jgi:hypothetical protein